MFEHVVEVRNELAADDQDRLVSEHGLAIAYCYKWTDQGGHPDT